MREELAELQVTIILQVKRVPRQRAVPLKRAQLHIHCNPQNESGKEMGRQSGGGLSAARWSSHGPAPGRLRLTRGGDEVLTQGQCQGLRDERAQRGLGRREADWAGGGTGSRVLRAPWLGVRPKAAEGL